MRLLAVACCWFAVAVAVAPLAACKGQQGTPKLDILPVTEDEAHAFGEQLVTMVKPCAVDKMTEWFDNDAMASKFLSRSQLPTAKQIAAQLQKSNAGPRIFCAWMRGIDD